MQMQSSIVKQSPRWSAGGYVTMLQTDKRSRDFVRSLLAIYKLKQDVFNVMDFF